MISAYVLIVVRPGTESVVAEKLIKKKEISDVDIVYGDFDIITKVKVSSMEKLSSFIKSLRESVSEIERTQTMIVMQ